MCKCEPTNSRLLITALLRRSLFAAPAHAACASTGENGCRFTEEIRTGREKQHCCHEGVPENKTTPSHLRRLSRVDSSCHWTSTGAHWSVPHTVSIRLERPAAVCLLWQQSGLVGFTLHCLAGLGPAGCGLAAPLRLRPLLLRESGSRCGPTRAKGGFSLVARGGCTERQMARCALTRAD